MMLGSLFSLVCESVKYDTYYEPFIVGGAVLFHLKPPKAVINDTNEQLINVYRRLQKDPREVIKRIRSLDKADCDKFT